MLVVIARSNLWLSIIRRAQESLRGIKLWRVNCLLCGCQALCTGVPDKFFAWVYETCGPQVKEYLKETQLPLKCLLVMDSANAHPQDLDDDLPGGFDFINVKFLPSYTTPLLQLMDQQVISSL